MCIQGRATEGEGPATARKEALVGGKNLAEFSAISFAIEEKRVWQYLTTDFGAKGNRLGCQWWSAVADSKRDADSRAKAANPLSECRVALSSQHLPVVQAALGNVDPVRSAVLILVVSPVGVEPASLLEALIAK